MKRRRVRRGDDCPRWLLHHRSYGPALILLLLLLPLGSSSSSSSMLLLLHNGLNVVAVAAHSSEYFPNWYASSQSLDSHEDAAAGIVAHVPPPRNLRFSTAPTPFVCLFQCFSLICLFTLNGTEEKGVKPSLLLLMITRKHSLCQGKPRVKLLKKVAQRITMFLEVFYDFIFV